MAEIINLNKARKARSRAGRAEKAVENRIRFGRTKAEKAVDKAESERNARDLDGAKRD
jgi:hypothetical protein